MKWNTELISIPFMRDDDNHDIELLRPTRNQLNPFLPYHFLQEEEPDEHGNLQKVHTIFLTGKECAFKCVMCDLWKNALPMATPPGAIVKQLDYALPRLEEAEVIKLYNSSNFFDPKAIPPADYPAIIDRLSSYKRVIVENHPKLCSQAVIDFSERLNGTLEVAMGLETIHPLVLPKLNKKLTGEDFKEAVTFLGSNAIPARAFILLNPPYLTNRQDNIEWTLKTIEFAFDCGVGCCSIIATRSGNGIMDALEKQGDYVAPTLDSLEEVFERALSLKKGRVFADTWEIGFLSRCDQCFEARKRRIEEMNLSQKIIERLECNCN